MRICTTQDNSIFLYQMIIYNTKMKIFCVNLDKDKEKWKAKKDDAEKSNVLSFIVENDWDSDFVRDYQIRSIPRFIIIDEHGRLIT